MINGFEEYQKFGAENLNRTVASFGVLSKSIQSIAAETADYSKRSFEDSAAFVEKLIGAKSLESAVELQTDYAKSTYEGAVAQATRLGELYSDLAADALKPFEKLARGK